MTLPGSWLRKTRCTGYHWSPLTPPGGTCPPHSGPTGGTGIRLYLLKTVHRINVVFSHTGLFRTTITSCDGSTLRPLCAPAGPARTIASEVITTAKRITAASRPVKRNLVLVSVSRGGQQGATGPRDINPAGYTQANSITLLDT